MSDASIKMPFRYAAGSLGSRFLVALRDRSEILGSRCARCGHVRCPPQEWCARCGGVTGDLVAVGPSGTLEAWTDVTGRGTYGLIRLDGADTALLHRLLGPSDGWSEGDRVRARFSEVPKAGIEAIEGFGRETGAP